MNQFAETARLTDTERYAIWAAGDHAPELCDCTGSDWSAEGEWCGGAEDTFAAVERIIAARQASLRDEWAATDVTSVELEQWPDHTSIRATREAAEDEFVHDGDDVLLHRRVSDWQPSNPPASSTPDGDR